MKQNYIILAIMGLALLSCSEKKLSDSEILASRTVTGIEMSYLQDGAPVKSLNFTSKASFRTIDVQLNNENLIWDIESDRDWCVVLPEKHRGSGNFTLEVAANEDFEDRSAATLTFVAGNYRGFQIKVNQNGSAFIISQPYFVSRKNGDAFEISVTTLAGTDWEASTPDWIRAEKGGEQPGGEFTTTKLTLTTLENGESGRYGAVTLSSGNGEKDEINIAQFGSDLNYDEAGNIFFDSGVDASLSFLAPEFMIDSFELPDYAQAAMKTNDDGTVTVTISLSENLSDCSEIRESTLGIKLNNASASTVTLPPIRQSYVPAHGLVTAKGVQRFAVAIAAGEDTSDWETDGTVVMVGDIDMTGVSDWTGIGTDEKPFTGKFDGKNHSILNLKGASAGFFHKLSGATVKNLTIGKGCTIYTNVKKDDETALGGIADEAEGSSISGCTYSGSLDFAGTHQSDGLTAFVGGILGKGDATTSVNICKLEDGTVSASSVADEDTELMLGGIAGRVLGTVSNCENSGTINHSSGLGSIRLGGILAWLPEGSTVSNNVFSGTINLSGSSADMVIGGLYGLVTGTTERKLDKASDKSLSMGSILINKYKHSTDTYLYAGGFVGMVETGGVLTVKGYEAQTNFNIDYASENRVAKNVNIGGVLGGCRATAVSGQLTFEDLKNSGNIVFKISSSIACSVRRLWIGGVAGSTNGPASFISCTNVGEIGKSETSSVYYVAKSNGYNQMTGGIAGYCHGGNTLFKDCVNRTGLENHMYNNNGVTGVNENMYTPQTTGGILGGFNYGTSIEPYTLTMTSCSNIGSILAYRGYTGGIVGYCFNATITSCTNTGSLSNGANDQCAFRGGIVGGAGNTTISNCQANCNVTAIVAGSADYGCAGGIAGLARPKVADSDVVVIENCAYFGNVNADKKSTDKPEYPGGIIGLGTEETTINNCKFGGEVRGVPVSENNVAELPIGNKVGTVNGITYWNGN